MHLHSQDHCCRVTCWLLLQIVYVAPMKALAAEVTANFGKRLAALGLVVKELTGAMTRLCFLWKCAVVRYAVLCCSGLCWVGSGAASQAIDVWHRYYWRGGRSRFGIGTLVAFKWCRSNALEQARHTPLRFAVGRVHSHSHLTWQGIT